MSHGRTSDEPCFSPPTQIKDCRHGAVCHGPKVVDSGPRDLRYLTAQAQVDFQAIVRADKLTTRGMAPLGDVLSEEHVGRSHASVIFRGQQDWQPGVLPQPARR